MKFTLFFAAGQVLSALSLVNACAEGHDEHENSHGPSKREHLSAPLTPPSRPLHWGDINVLHTTDSHGWLLGHQKAVFPEPNYR